MTLEDLKFVGRKTMRKLQNKTNTELAGDGPAADSFGRAMLMKMGWKEGQGLGKSDQGMTTPLMAKKDGRRSGVIVAAPPNERRE